MALVNGQPFFFPDTTSYIRSADMPIYLATRGKISTEWTNRYKDQLQDFQKRPGKLPISPEKRVSSEQMRGNDLSQGSVMSGRSPYFGLFLYLTYILGNFWSFVLIQSAVCLYLIRLALVKSGVGSTRNTVLVVATLALFTNISYYNSLLLADALASFGILSFIILVIYWTDLSRTERIILATILLGSCVSHLTHIAMVGAMLALLAALALLKIVRVSRHALVVATLVLVASCASISLTSFVVETVFRKPPQLIPLMTARFVADGPGFDYIQSGCDGADFAACKLKLRRRVSDAEFLWSTEPGIGMFVTSDQQTRRQLSAQDTKFAWAVLRKYPLQQGGSIVANTMRQLLTYDYGGLNSPCHGTACAPMAPTFWRSYQGSLSGRNLWQNALLDRILDLTLAISCLFLIFALFHPEFLGRSDKFLLRLWAAFVATAMLTCAFLGGAISDPQFRYQGRLVWLLPFLALLALSMRLRKRVEAPGLPPVCRSDSVSGA